MLESELAYFMPLFAFLLVFIITYALLAKTKLLGDNAFVHMFVSFIVAIIFFISPTAQEFARLSMPWVAVFLVCLVLILMTLAFVGGKIENVIKVPIVGKIAVLVLLAIFLISAIQIFGPVVEPYLPGSTAERTSEPLSHLSQVIFHPTVIGAVLLLMVAAVISWVLTKK